MTDDQSQPPSEAEREELRTAIDELMRGPVAVYQPRALPSWVSE